MGGKIPDLSDERPILDLKKTCYWSTDNLVNVQTRCT